MSVTLRSIGRWKKDSEVDACEGCQSDFGVFTRRHHCRSCGGIFCASCTPSLIVLKLVHPTEAQRVCAACYNRIVYPPAVAPSPPSPPTHTTTDSVAPAIACAKAVESEEVHTEVSKNAVEAKANRETESPPRSRSGSEASDDFDRPLDMASRLSAIVSSRQVASTNNLSFLSVLQDGLKKSSADNVLNILLFASAERQQAMVVTVEPSETMGDVAARLTEMYFKLENPPFRKMTTEAASTLRDKLRFSSEYQVISPSTEATAIASQARHVVLSVFPPEAVAQMSKTNTTSERSLKEFWRSERSEHCEDAADNAW